MRKEEREYRGTNSGCTHSSRNMDKENVQMKDLKEKMEEGKRELIQDQPRSQV